MDKVSPDKKWSGTFTLIRHMSGLEEWFLCHSMERVTYTTSCLITQMEYGFKR
jgi:hypothetical protein